MKISAILLAAGFASRFGSNKLLFPVEGTGMFETTLRKVMGSNIFAEIIVVTQYDEVAHLAGGYGIQKIIRNDHPEEGISSSVKLGVQAADPGHGLMFLVCDQPYLKQETVYAMASAFRQGILCASWEGRRGNPVVFGPEFRNELLALSGDKGGRQVMKNHEDQVAEFPVHAEAELKDYDTAE